jgi:hypothetical protein
LRDLRILARLPAQTMPAPQSLRRRCAFMSAARLTQVPEEARERRSRASSRRQQPMPTRLARQMSPQGFYLWPLRA